VGGGCAQPAWFFSDQTTNTETNVIQIGPVLGAPILTNFTYWDYDANVGLVLGTNGTITIVDNVFSTLGQHQFPFLAESAKIGIWSLEIYSVTLEGNMVCVIDRLALLSFSVNVSHICGSPLSGHGTHQWTPATAAFQFPSLEITSANTGTLGALFVRMHDDELENGAHTPAFDWIDVEHWTNINFTTSTHIPLRYTISVHDFVYNGTIGNQFVIYNGTLSGVFMNGPIDVAWFQLLWKEPTLSLAAQFVLLQQGALENYTDPAVWVDLDGTMVVSLYDPASGTSKSTARLVNDPLGTLRPVPNVGYQMEPSFVQSWVAKHFYHGTEHLQIKTETVVRLFTAQDGCNTTFCEQIISEIL
jgi:hypothetical protein